MIRFIRRRRSALLLLALLSVLLTGGRAAGAEPAVPVLTRAAASVDAPGRLLVAGEDFTPGGLVYVGLYGGEGAGRTLLGESRPHYGANGSLDPAAEPGGAAFGAVYGAWVTADPTAYGPNGSADPARGFVRGGTATLSFAIPCGEVLAARALDQTTGAWSTWAGADPGC